MTLLFSLTLLVLSLSPVFSVPAHFSFRHQASNGPAYGLHGGISTEHAMCSDIGVRILQKGGSAVDAAIAGLVCVGTVNSFHSGIGGGGFMIVRDSDGTYETIDFRESAPTGANANMFVNDTLKAQIGGLSIGVPGELRGFQYAHEKYGSLAWEELVEPSIPVARNGFPAGAKLVEALHAERTHIMSNPLFREIYAPTGDLVSVGDHIKLTKLSETLELIAKHGPDIFYDPDGPIAPSLIKTILETGGIMTMDDLVSFRPVTGKPLSTTYRGLKVMSSPAQSSGVILLEILSVLNLYEFPHDLDAVTLQRIVEAVKFGYAFRTELGDPRYEEHVRRRVKEVLTPEYILAVRNNITDDRTHPVDYYNPIFADTPSPGTTHASAMDASGQIVSVTSTINLWFGSKVIDYTTGIILNDEMDDFSIPGSEGNAFGLKPSPFNFVKAGKRPLSSAVPTIIESDDGAFCMAIGASGGSRIITATLNSIINVVDFGMNMYDGIKERRFHHQLMPNRVELEGGFGESLAESLEKRGHEIRWGDAKGGAGSAVYGIVRRDWVFEAAADPRNFGAASAY